MILFTTELQFAEHWTVIGSREFYEQLAVGQQIFWIDNDVHASDTLCLTQELQSPVSEAEEEEGVPKSKLLLTEG